MKFALCVIIMTILGSFASLFLKRISNKILFFDKNLYIGGFLYILAAIINIYLLKYYDYSLILPLTSLTYIWSLLIANIYLKEKINKRKILGILIVGVGVIILVL